MTTPEIFMWAATALNIVGLCRCVYYARKVVGKNRKLVTLSNNITEDLLQKNVRLMVENMGLLSERNELREGAAFDALVAKKLAKLNPFFLECNSSCHWHKMDPKDPFECIHRRDGLGPCKLREARLMVEEEMDRADR